MNYLCLMYQDDQKNEGLGSADSAAQLADRARSLKELRSSHNLVVSTHSIPTSSTTTVRVRNGRLVLTDGMACTGSEQIAGFFILDARDLNEALRLAARNPVARSGSIEVHPLPDLVIEHSAANAADVSVGETGAKQ